MTVLQPRGKEKDRLAKTTWRRTVEKKRSKAGWQSWREGRTAAQDKNQWRAPCGGPMRQLGARGQVKVNSTGELLEWENMKVYI